MKLTYRRHPLDLPGFSRTHQNGTKITNIRSCSPGLTKNGLICNNTKTSGSPLETCRATCAAVFLCFGLYINWAKNSRGEEEQVVEAEQQRQQQQRRPRRRLVSERGRRGEEGGSGPAAAAVLAGDGRLRRLRRVGGRRAHLLRRQGWWCSSPFLICSPGGPIWLDALDGGERRMMGAWWWCWDSVRFLEELFFFN